LYPDSEKKQARQTEPDWVAIHEELAKHKNLNLQFMWEEYREQNPDGKSYSWFCEQYRKYRKAVGRGVSLYHERKAGELMEVDWMGDTLACMVDAATGELSEAHFFVATIGYSHYPYVEAFTDEEHESWMTAHVHALEWMGGVPRVIVPDNCKTAVTKASYYDPKLNPAYWDLARHYGVAVIPARVRKPRDKASVEGSVGWLETWLLEWLRGQRFFSFEELNRAVWTRVRQLVKRPFQKRAGSRASVFETVDKPALRPLPPTRYEHVEYVMRRVPDNYHVEYDGRYYSVPYTLFKQKVTLRIGTNMIEILTENRERVALHQRQGHGSRYVTVTEHMPKKHQCQREANKRDGDSYRAWAKTIGEETWSVVDAMLRAQQVEESAYRSCMGVLQMAKKHGNSQLEKACEQARKLGSPTYTTIKHLLQNQAMAKTSAPLPAHENLRDPAEFA
jgi:transposase